MDDENKASKREHFFYYLFMFGQNVIWAYAGLVSTYLLDIGIDPGTASVILLAPKIWDAVNDTLFGIIVDRFQLKKNEKFLPWVRIGTAFAGVTIIAMFSIPASLKNPAAKIWWFVIAYILFDAAYTMQDAPIYAMPTVATSNINERSRFVAGGKMGGILGAMIATVLIPVIRPKTGWMLGAILFCAFGTAGMVPYLVVAEERTRDDEIKETPSLKDILTYLVNNKYLQIVLLVMLVIGCCSVESVMALILARNCFENESYATIITAIATLPVLLISAFVPKMIKIWDKTIILICGLVFSIVASIISFFVGYNNSVFTFIFLGLKGVGLAFYNIITYMMVADTVEYGVYKTDVKATGISFSLQTFVSKLKNALVNSIALGALAIFGYDSTLAEGVKQAPKVINGIWGVFNILPAIGYAIAVVLLVVFYKLRDKDVQTMASYNNGEIAREEAEEKLKEKYGEAAE